jgi:SAM-dependent methyltransferase
MERSPEDIRQHYEIEKELADRVRGADRSKRSELYGRVYDELFRRVPRHPQLVRKSDLRARSDAVVERMALLSRFIRPSTIFLEIGAGDCALSRHIARSVKKCIALDVSREILDKAADLNVDVVLSDGCSIPVLEGSVTLAYSYQVMEHVHPDDAVEQLRNIHRALAKGGLYVCVTPNRLNGPHDVSRYFDQVARGLHLKEYTFSELDNLFRQVGFRRTTAYVGFRHRYFRAPSALLVALEATLARIPYRLRHWLGNLRGFQNLLVVTLAGEK